MSINPTSEANKILLNSKSKLKDLKLKKELCFLFIANAFGKMYLDGAKTQYDSVNHLVHIGLGRKSKVYGKQVENILKDCMDIFEYIEKQERKKINKGVKHRFQKRLSFNENDELEVHGLLFCVALILEHKEIPNKKLYLPYAEAKKIYEEFDGRYDNMYKNARVLPSLFREYLGV